MSIGIYDMYDEIEHVVVLYKHSRINRLEKIFRKDGEVPQQETAK